MMMDQLVLSHCSIRVVEFLLITPTATMLLTETASRQKRTAFEALDGQDGVYSPETHRSPTGGGTATNDPNPLLELGGATRFWPPP
jgi:hypothetical protein